MVSIRASPYSTTGIRKNLGDPHYMPVLRIPTPLRAYTNGQSNINVAGANISEALNDLTWLVDALDVPAGFAQEVVTARIVALVGRAAVA